MISPPQKKNTNFEDVYKKQIHKSEKVRDFRRTSVDW